MNIQNRVKEYYGEELSSSGDLKTNACCTTDDEPAFLRALLDNIHDDVMQRYYGCGLIAPLCLEGARVLDLGCGAGRDAYVLAQLVGPEGSVVGVDMTTTQLEAARRLEAWHVERFGFARSNLSFVEGYLERLEETGLAPDSFDAIVSNCVINLCVDKSAVLRAVRNLLKPGGEFYFADIYADRRIPEHLRTDPVLYGECLGGALYWNDFLILAKEAGFPDPRLVTSRPVEVRNEALKSKLGATKFYSATYRLFRADGLEPACEDYGQAVAYKGGVMHAEDVFVLDRHHIIESGRVFPVCGNTWRILKQSRFAPYFEFIGNFDAHYGIFPRCGTTMPFEEKSASGAASGACC
ncbi:MAG: methyltransferase domain-containing protein [Parvularculaceae bacterium]